MLSKKEKKGNNCMFHLTEKKLMGKAYPFKIKTVDLGLVFSIQSAHEIIIQRVKHKSPNRYGFFLDETQSTKNIDEYNFNRLVYNQDGSFLGLSSYLSDNVPFTGNDSPKFPMGQIVEVIYGKELRLGVVCAVPPSKEYVRDKQKKSPSFELKEDDNVYLVCFDGKHDHTHPTEVEMRISTKKVNARLVAKLNKIYSKLKIEE
jgi:hypothetical protein